MLGGKSYKAIEYFQVILVTAGAVVFNRAVWRQGLRLYGLADLRVAADGHGDGWATGQGEGIDQGAQ